MTMNESYTKDNGSFGGVHSSNHKKTDFQRAQLYIVLATHSLSSSAI